MRQTHFVNRRHPPTEETCADSPHCSVLSVLWKKFPDQKVMIKQCFPSYSQTYFSTVEALKDQYTLHSALTDIFQVGKLNYSMSHLTKTGVFIQ